MIELIASAYRDAITIAAAADRSLIHADQSDAVAAIAGRFSPAVLGEIIEQLSRYEQLLWRNANPKIVWDNVAITCLSAEPLNL